MEVFILRDGEDYDTNSSQAWKKLDVPLEDVIKDNAGKKIIRCIWRDDDGCLKSLIIK